MSPYYPNPPLDEELAYRRELLTTAIKQRRRSRRGALVPRPPPRRADPRRVPTAVLSEARATIDAVPRWDDAPMVGRADELGRLLAHVDRAVAGRSSAVLLAGDAGVGQDPAARRARRARRRARRPRAGRPLRRPRRRRAALPAVRRPAAPGRRRARPRAGRRRPTRCWPGCWPAARRAAAGAPGERGPRARPPAAEPGGPAAGRRRAAPAVRVGRRADLRARGGRARC